MQAVVSLPAFRLARRHYRGIAGWLLSVGKHYQPDKRPHHPFICAGGEPGNLPAELLQENIVLTVGLNIKAKLNFRRLQIK